jgi:hypothetical protein
MSHLHCPACRYAYNTLSSDRCPRCAPARPPTATPPLDAMAEVDLALDRLAAALGRLADDELDAVAMRLASTEHPDTWAGVIAGAIAAAVLSKRREVETPVVRIALEPPAPIDAEPPMTARERALVALALGLLARLAAVTREAATRFRRW